MAKYSVAIRWEKSQSNQEQYFWRFENGLEVRASTHAGATAMVDPESAFIASISSCHMLSLMAVAVKKGYVIKRYEDKAVGALEKNSEGRIAITRVLLQPYVEFAGPNIPDASEVERLHDTAHRNCFIANSVISKVHIEPQRILQES